MTKPSTPPHTPLPRRALQRLLMAACLAGAAVSAGAQPQGSPQMNLRRVELTAGVHRIDAQVAASDRERALGLMFRPDMPAPEGMIFVFEVPAVQCLDPKSTP